MATAFIVCLAMGLVGIVGVLIVGEAGAGLGDTGSDGLPFLSLTTLATALLGFGAGGGAVTALGGEAWVAGVAAVGAAAVLVVLTRGLLLPYLLRQQSNSQISRLSYIGLTGTVTIPISPDGWGEIAFVDADGNRVRSRAVTTEPAVLPTGTPVYISDAFDDEHLHVVSIPDSSTTNNALPETN